MFTFARNANNTGTIATAVVDEMLTFGGNSMWSDEGKQQVRVVKLEMELYEADEDMGGMAGDLRVYVEGWDTAAQGLIYTDEQFGEDARQLVDKLLRATCTWMTEDVLFDVVDEVGYSEQGMQGDDYVSMDAYLMGDCLMRAAREQGSDA